VVSGEWVRNGAAFDCQWEPPPRESVPFQVSATRSGNGAQMSASSGTSSLESLIRSIVPQSRSDHVIFNDLLAHCKDLLSR